MADPNGALKKRIVEYIVGLLEQNSIDAPKPRLVKEIAEAVEVLVGKDKVAPIEWKVMGPNGPAMIPISYDERGTDAPSTTSVTARQSRTILSLEEDLAAMETKLVKAQSARDRYRGVLVEIYAVGKTAIDKEVRDGS